MLKHLIAEAVALAGGNLCASRHEWESEGGRGCPKYENAGCSQTVYVCTRCGEYDYGGKGGPSHHECFVTCNRDFTDERVGYVEPPGVRGSYEAYDLKHVNVTSSVAGETFKGTPSAKQMWRPL